jgi:hypothetical protein
VFKGHIEAMHRLGFVPDIEVRWARLEARLLSNGEGQEGLNAPNVCFCVPGDWFDEEMIQYD